MFGALKRGRFRSLASLILVVSVVGKLQQKRTRAASRGFLAAARLSCYCLRLRESMKHSVLTFASRCQISSLTDWSLESEIWTDSLLLVTPRHLSRSIGYITPDCTALETSVSALPAFYLFSICIEYRIENQIIRIVPLYYGEAAWDAHAL